ncbi:hypothetical protein DFP73DRAFT_565232 [Morchella snyderi]|nr:hypothetical protein DFP73DRAFT_565232 [Morchella snyderi]
MSPRHVMSWYVHFLSLTFDLCSRCLAFNISLPFSFLRPGPHCDAAAGRVFGVEGDFPSWPGHAVCQCASVVYNSLLCDLLVY